MSLLTDYLSDPACVRAWQPREWNRFLPLLRESRLMTRALCLAEAADLIDAVPARIVDQMIGARAQTRYVQVQAMRELGHVLRALQHDGIRVAALKGIAYRVADLPLAQWRGLSDIDLLIDRADLARAEALLLRSGWVVNGEFDDYDQRYYREWMHELPPMMHIRRGTVVDVHHDIVPSTAGRATDPGGILRRATPLPELPALFVPSPEDLVVHSLTHLMHEGELHNGLRDLFDVHQLVGHFGAGGSFWERVVRVAVDGAVAEPVAYGIHLVHAAFGTAVPQAVRVELGRAAKVPFWLEPIYRRALEPAGASRLSASARLAQSVLFVRAHRLRMPWPLLVRHLAVKGVRAIKPEAARPRPAREMPAN